MKDKAIELFDKIAEVLDKDFEYIGDITHVKSYIVKLMLEFGHYVAEEQKKQCLKESKIDESVITRSKIEKQIKINEDYDISDEFEVIVWETEEEGVGCNVSSSSILNSRNVCNDQ